MNQEAQAAILVYFRTRGWRPREVGPFEFHDKIPLKTGSGAGVRVVPPGGSLRAFLSEAGTMMPGYVNIGARVGAGTMVDTWATVGSCAQIGRDVHLAGGVGIGGVLEPPGARPVIVEDGAFIGSRVVIVEGVHVGQRGRAGAGRRSPRRSRSSTSPAPSRSSTAAPCRREPSSFPARGRRPSRPASSASLRADHRQAHRVDRPEDVPERRACAITASGRRCFPERLAGEWS